MGTLVALNAYLWLLKHTSGTLAGSYGYSDSVNDMPLLEAVDKPHVVNPSAGFQQMLQPRQWPQLRWQLPAAV